MRSGRRPEPASRGGGAAARAAGRADDASNGGRNAKPVPGAGASKSAFTPRPSREGAVTVGAAQRAGQQQEAGPGPASTVSLAGSRSAGASSGQQAGPSSQQSPATAAQEPPSIRQRVHARHSGRSAASRTKARARSRMVRGLY